MKQYFVAMIFVSIAAQGAVAETIGFGFSGGYDQNRPSLEDSIHGSADAGAGTDVAVDSDSGAEPGSDLAPSLETEPIGDPAGIDQEEDTFAAEDELRLSAQETRSRFDYAASIFLGPAIPWSAGGLEYTIFHKDDLMSAVAYGTGTWEITSRHEQAEFKFSARTMVLSYWFEKFFAETVPIFAGGMVGGAMFAGDLDPTGATVGGNTEDNLRTTFDSSGLMLGARVGIAPTWDNGFFLRWTMLNFAKYFEYTSSFNRESRSTKSLVRDTVNQPRSWGITNVTIGYAF